MLCNSTISTSTTTTTPSWLRRLHASKGLSFPSHLHLDLFLQTPPNPPPSKPHANPPSNPNPNPNPNAISSILSDLFVMPSRPPPHAAAAAAAPKSLRKQPRPRAARSPPPPPPPPPAAAEKPKAKGRKRRRAAAAAAAEGVEERCTRTEVTVIDTSTEGWKASKLLFRKGSAWKVREKKVLGGGGVKKRRRRVGLVGRLGGGEKEVEKGGRVGNSDEGNIYAGNGDTVQDSDDHIQPPLRRPRFSGPVPEGKSTSILRLQITSKGKKNGLAGSKGTPKGK